MSNKLGNFLFLILNRKCENILLRAIVTKKYTVLFTERKLFCTFTFNRYGLLGASGCGKTTLLSCIVGRKRLNSGEIWVLGGMPGTVGSGVPGPRVGYMPQVNEIKNTINNFRYARKCQDFYNNFVSIRCEINTENQQL